MQETLAKNSRILQLKSKFFLGRAFLYSSFLMIPVWLPKLLDLNTASLFVILLCYIMFIGGQWFLLGKEIDHRFKIYFRVSSSMDRVFYRLFLGMITMVIYFGLLGFLPVNILKHFYWGTWIFLGLFYSWPTRGKIIEETMSGHFIEFRFLDSFEKTLMILILGVFIISFPQIPYLEDVEALKLYFDPSESMSPLFWNFLSVNYFPFAKFSKIFRLAYFMHFYIVGAGMFLMGFYALVRIFMSRRLAMLGTFSLISCWPFSQLFGANLSSLITSTFSLYWVWGFFWCIKSSTYRAGLIIGLIGFWGVLLRTSLFYILPLQMLFYYFYFFNFKNLWFRKQLIKYMSLGLLLSFVLVLTSYEGFLAIYAQGATNFVSTISTLLESKAFYWLFPLGFALLSFLFFSKTYSDKQIGIELARLKQFMFILIFLIMYSFLMDGRAMGQYGLMWLIAFLALLPLEWIFHILSRLRSRRNFIFLTYIIICLLDSHIEGRIKILIEFFNERY